MEWGTVGQSELKGNVGGDLAVLRERLGEVEKAKGGGGGGGGGGRRGGQQQEFAPCTIKAERLRR